jgi:NTE family protein
VSDPTRATSAPASWPVRRIPTDPEDGQPEQGLALCLSGGGYRAMLFHVGALWRLNEGGYLPRLDRVSSVSGGSITAGVLGLRWSRLAFDADGVGQRFGREVVAPLRRLASVNVDVWASLRGLFGFGNASAVVIAAYRRYLFRHHTLQELPDRPRYVFNATNVQSGVLWRFSKPYAADYRVGKLERPTIELAVAVAASSAFPPFLSPVVLERSPGDLVREQGNDLHYPPFTTRIVLTDGGVYDNLGLETAWKRYQTVLVSDGGGHTSAEPRPRRAWLSQARRVLDLIDSQVRALRKRQLIEGYQAGLRAGAYWGIGTNIADYGLAETLPCPFDKTQKIAAIQTRLARMDSAQQERLINWGYAVCDAALRRHVDAKLPAPSAFPYPSAGVG